MSWIVSGCQTMRGSVIPGMGEVVSEHGHGFESPRLTLGGIVGLKYTTLTLGIRKGLTSHPWALSKLGASLENARTIWK